MDEITEMCGHHCGVKDEKAGHCPCKECHDVLGYAAVFDTGR